MFVMMFGAIILQLPIGWRGDMVDRGKLSISWTLLATLGSALGPFALE